MSSAETFKFSNIYSSFSFSICKGRQSFLWIHAGRLLSNIKSETMSHLNKLSQNWKRIAHFPLAGCVLVYRYTDEITIVLFCLRTFV